MSGFEIAGVVLGAIPLIIEGLKFYCEGISTIKRIVRFREEFFDEYVDFEVSLTILKNDCEEYLSNLDIPDRTYQNLTEHGKGWDAPDVQDQLRKKLGDHCEQFMKLFERINKRIQCLGSKLGLKKDFSVPFVVNDGSGNVVDKRLCEEFFTPWRCVKGGLMHGAYKVLMSKIESDIEKLRRLALGSIKRTQNFYGTDVISTPSELCPELQLHALRLYHDLDRSWTQHCKSSHTHQAQLLVTPAQEAATHSLPEFHLSLSLECNEMNAAMLPWRQRDIKVFPLQKLESCQRRVRFVLRASGSQAPESVQRSPCDEKCEIDSLCESLSLSQRGTACFGCFVSPDYCYHVHEASTPRTQNERLAQLSTILSRSTRKGLTLKERTTIAFALAWAVIELYETPWLRDDWDLDDFHIAENVKSHALYIVETFNDRESPLQHHPPDKKAKLFLVKSKILFALGTALLELWNGQPLLDCQTDDDRSHRAGDLTNVVTVYRLLDSLQEGEPRARFSRAVAWCIEPVNSTNAQLGRPQVYELSDQQFRNEFYQNVVIPLQQDYDFVMGNRP